MADFNFHFLCRNRLLAFHMVGSIHLKSFDVSMASSISKEESIVRERSLLRSTYIPANLGAVTVMDKEDYNDDQEGLDGSESKDATPVVSVMFVNVKMEINDSEYYSEDQESNTGEEHVSADFVNGNSNNTSIDLTHAVGGPSQPKGIIAKLAHKLNSKLNSEFSQSPTDSLLACLEPEVSVATSGTITSGGLYVCPWCPLTTSRPETLEDHQNLCHRIPAEDGSRRRHRFVTQSEALTMKGENFLRVTQSENIGDRSLLPSRGGDKTCFSETIAERLKERGILSFGGGKIQLQLLKDKKL